LDHTNTNMRPLYGGRSILQWAELGAVAIYTIWPGALALMGLGIRGGLLISLSGLAGIAGLWLLTAPTVDSLRREPRLRLTGTVLGLAGMWAAGTFLMFEIRTGRDLGDFWFAALVCIAPMSIGVHRLFLAWRR
jgi:hypothetical protein